MLLPAQILQPQFIVRRGAQDVLATVVARDDVGMFSVVKRMGDIRAVDIAVVIRNADFGAVQKRRVPAERFTRSREESVTA